MLANVVPTLSKVSSIDILLANTYTFSRCQGRPYSVHARFSVPLPKFCGVHRVIETLWHCCEAPAIGSKFSIGVSDIGLRRRGDRLQRERDITG